MARLIKNNAEYFTHDADMRNDIKIKALRRKFSHTGYAVWCYLLESMTDAEFFELDFENINIELLAADYDITTEELVNIVDYCCLIKLLQRSEDGSRLFCETQKRRFSALLSKRERDRNRCASIAKRDKVDSRSDKADSRSDKADSCDDIALSRGENPHSKVKESKVKESKAKERANALVDGDEVAALWNSACKSLPKAISLNADRRKKIESRAQEIAASGRDPMVTFGEIFRAIERSDFLAGRSGKKWRASFDWIFQNGNNWVKVLEGNYSDEAASGPVSPSDPRLGIGERIESGRRTYGSGKATIPMSAPPRPSEQYSWNAETNEWVIL